MDQRSVTAMVILVVTTVTMGQENYQAGRVLPQQPIPNLNTDIFGSPLGILKPGGDLPLHGGTRKSDPFDPLLSNPLGSLDLSSLGSREARLRQWLADNTLPFDSLRAEFHPDRHHTGAHIIPPVHPTKPNVHGQTVPKIIDPFHGQTGPKIIDPLHGQTGPKIIDPFHGQTGPKIIDPLHGQTVPKIIDPLHGAGHGGGKIDNLHVPGVGIGGLVPDPRRIPAGGFPTAY